MQGRYIGFGMEGGEERAGDAVKMLDVAHDDDMVW